MSCGGRTRRNWLNCCNEKLGWKLEKNYPTLRLVKHGNGLHRDAVESSSMKVFKNRLDRHLSWIISVNFSSLIARGSTRRVLLQGSLGFPIFLFFYLSHFTTFTCMQHIPFTPKHYLLEFGECVSVRKCGEQRATFCWPELSGFASRAGWALSWLSRYCWLLACLEKQPKKVWTHRWTGRYSWLSWPAQPCFSSWLSLQLTQQTPLPTWLEKQDQAVWLSQYHQLWVQFSWCSIP